MSENKINDGALFSAAFEPDDGDEPTTVNVLKCPTRILTAKVLAEAKKNYLTLGLGSNATNGWGMTGLMSMVPWWSNFYGQVNPGYILLFPGGYNNLDPKTYTGQPMLNGKPYLPLVTARVGGTPLHQQMCMLLGQPTESFIGFAIGGYPLSKDKVGYNSGVCNPNYFGQRDIPQDCDGFDWQALVYKALENGLR